MEADTGKIERKKVSIQTVRKVYSTQSIQYAKYTVHKVQYTVHKVANLKYKAACRVPLSSPVYKGEGQF